VQNADKLVNVFAQDTVESAATLWREHFAFVTFANGCDFVGKENSGLEKVQSSEEFYAAQGEKSLVQIG